MSSPAGDPADAVAAAVSAASAPTTDVFAGVPEALRPALQRRGFQKLTAVQDAVLSVRDQDRDLQITSQTGSGKTVALGFVLAARLLAQPPRGRGPSTLVIAPTRELAAQVKDELQWLFADLRIGLDCVTGGTSVGAERFRLARKPAIVVGTPGRLLDHIQNGALDVSGVTQLVLDEADQMLDMGFRDELDGILSTMPPERRTHLVSATFPPEVLALTQRYQQEALHLAGTAAGQAHADIEHIAHAIGPRDRYGALVNLLLLAGDERTLVFVRTRQDTTGLADKLAADGFAALPISGDLAQAQRTRTLAAFRRGAVTTLIATDVASRGLDIPNVTLVVHVDPPVDPETYTHRSGRTGRAGQKGKSVMLAPRPRERAIRRLLAQAKVAVQWLPVPDATVVRARQVERLGERVQQELAQAAPCNAQRALAQQLLTDKNAQDVVAGLLAAMTQEQTREPFSFGADGAHAAPRAHKPTAHAPTPRVETPVDAAPLPGITAPTELPPPPKFQRAPIDRGRAGAPPAWQARPARPDHDARDDRDGGDRDAGGRGGEREVSQGFARFRINWGRLNGAEPKRILAHVCRRGDVESRAIGSIDLNLHFSTFEVALQVADQFERRVERPDRRDPNLVITRDGSRKRPQQRHDVQEHSAE